MVTLLTEREGVIPAIAKGARAASSRRRIFLEPFHTLSVELAAGSGDLSAVRTATIATARAALLDDGLRLEAAGTASRWVRLLSPPRVPEPELFAALEALLDTLTRGESIDGALAAFGLLLLEALGYGLELGRCARCARPRPPGRSAFVTAAGGGVVCDACRFGVAGQAPPIDGALIDAIAADPTAAASAPADSAAELLRIVRAAIDLRARAVGVKAGAR